MITWIKLAMSFFVFCILLFGFIYVFSPASMRNEMTSSSRVELPTNHTLVSPGESKTLDKASR
jgi:hypothetical protein